MKALLFPMLRISGKSLLCVKVYWLHTLVLLIRAISNGCNYGAMV
jgi:hypothetical protein